MFCWTVKDYHSQLALNHVVSYLANGIGLSDVPGLILEAQRRMMGGHNKFWLLTKFLQVSEVIVIHDIESDQNQTRREIKTENAQQKTEKAQPKTEKAEEILNNMQMSKSQLQELLHIIEKPPKQRKRKAPKEKKNVKIKVTKDLKTSKRKVENLMKTRIQNIIRTRLPYPNVVYPSNQQQQQQHANLLFQQSNQHYDSMNQQHANFPTSFANQQNNPMNQQNANFVTANQQNNPMNQQNTNTNFSTYLPNQQSNQRYDSMNQQTATFLNSLANQQNNPMNQQNTNTNFSMNQQAENWTRYQ